MLKCSVISLDGEDIVKISGGNVLRFDDLRLVIEELQNIESARQHKGSAEQTAHNSARDEIALINCTGCRFVNRCHIKFGSWRCKEARATSPVA